MSSLIGLFNRQRKPLLWLRHNRRWYHGAGCYGHGSNRGVISSNEMLTVGEEILANRIREPNLWQLVQAYRDHGHCMASLDPLAPPTRNRDALLDPTIYGLDLTKKYNTAGLVYGIESEATVKEIVTYLERTFCSTIALEVAHVQDEAEREWFVQRYELSLQNQITPERQLHIATLMHKAETFDLFLAKKKPTLKRYGGEGAESMMAFVDELYHAANKAGITDMVIGMPHRGRINLLTGALQVPAIALLHKAELCVFKVITLDVQIRPVFTGSVTYSDTYQGPGDTDFMINGWSEFAEEESCSGDILTHMTNSIDINIDGHPLHITMLPNPSHLEAVAPVVLGKTRAKQIPHKTGNYGDGVEDVNKVLCLQIHGDAAFSAQGIVMETLSMANLPHYSVGGSIHLVVNNQLGFTTPAEQGRSSRYCSDVVKMIDCPVIHVNGDYPEDAMRACKVAMEYRNRFGKDVLIDLVCFRRRGHNEGDDPSFTQPEMYRKVDAHPGPPTLYTRNQLEPTTVAEVENILANYKQQLNDDLKAADDYKPPVKMLQGQWAGLQPAPPTITNWDTGCPVDLMKFIGTKSVQIPEGKTIHARLMKAHVQERVDSVAKGTNLNWATAEALAIGTLLCQGFNVRLSGQDVGRGTFSHRHVMLVDQVTNETFIPLNNLTSNQSCFLEVANSLLSEEAVVGFEYGFSTESPKNLVIWEAQFGDFFNGAQLILDTYVSSGEEKWQLQSGLVLLLPHGMDGMGPEHSSCRMERFLQCSDSGCDQLDGDNINWHIVNPTTPAQYFHLLRRQMIRNFRKPLVVVAPKILLRHPQAVSSLSDMSPGTSFQHVLTDDTIDPKRVNKLIFCTGKHYYTLHEYRNKNNIEDMAIIRLECLCPFPSGYLHQQLSKYKGAKEFIWAQEEAQNMGAWSFVEPHFRRKLGIELTYRGRRVSAVPATGIKRIHDEQVAQLTKELFHVQ